MGPNPLGFHSSLPKRSCFIEFKIAEHYGWWTSPYLSDGGYNAHQTLPKLKPKQPIRQHDLKRHAKIHTGQKLHIFSLNTRHSHVTVSEIMMTEISGATIEQTSGSFPTDRSGIRKPSPQWNQTRTLSSNPLYHTGRARILWSHHHCKCNTILTPAVRQSLGPIHIYTQHLSANFRLLSVRRFVHFSFFPAKTS